MIYYGVFLWFQTAKMLTSNKIKSQIFRSTFIILPRPVYSTLASCSKVVRKAAIQINRVATADKNKTEGHMRWDTLKINIDGLVIFSSWHDSRCAKLRHPLHHRQVARTPSHEISESSLHFECEIIYAKQRFIKSAWQRYNYKCS